MIQDALGALLVRPYQFQIESAEVLWESRYGLSGDEMGLGKSLEAILCTVAHMSERPDAKIIFCVPAFLKANWYREIEKFTLHVNVCCCVTAKDIPDSFGKFDAVIINYEQLDKTKHLFRKATMVVVDEAHYLKTFDSKRTEIFTDYIRDFRPDRLVLLSGTPVKNRVPEYYSLIRLLDLNHQWTGHRLGRELGRYIPFCEYFCFKEERIIPGKRFPRVKYIGFRNQDTFFSLLNGRYVRHLAKDVLDLPPIVFQDIITKTMPDPKEEALNAELEELWEAYLMGIQQESLSSRKLENALLKVPYTVQFAKELLEGGISPILIFTDHVKPAELIGKTWARKSAFITGETPVAQRDAIVQKFQRGELDVLAATTSTMSAGWTLTKATRCIFNDKPWVPGDFLQAIKRIHRIGQSETCFIYNIVTTKLDQMIMGTLKSKIETLTQVLRKTC